MARRKSYDTSKRITPAERLAAQEAGKIDVNASIRGKNGRIRISRSPESKKIRDQVYEEYIAEKEDELSKLRGVVERSRKEETKKERKQREKEEKKKAKEEKKNDPSNMLFMRVSDLIPETYDEAEKRKKKEKKKKEKESNKKYGNLAGVTKKEKKRRKKAQQEAVDQQALVDARFEQYDKEVDHNMTLIDDTIKYVDAKIALMAKGGRSGGSPTAFANMVSAKASLISSRIQSTNSYASRIKTQNEIRLKNEKAGSVGNGMDPAEMIARLMPGMDKHSAMLASASGKNTGKSDKKKHGKRNGKKKDKHHDPRLQERMRELQESGAIELNEYDRNIEYEGVGTVVVLKNYSSGKWSFAAIDDDQRIIHDYPKSLLPKKKHLVANDALIFDDENDIVKDIENHRLYHIVEIYN